MKYRERYHGLSSFICETALPAAQYTLNTLVIPLARVLMTDCVKHAVS